MNKLQSLLPAVAVAILATGTVVAKADETQDVAVKIKAPVTSTACTATPPTISVLTLNVDVSQAVFDVEGGQAATCASLVPGQTVEVAVVNDSEPLEATKVDVESSDESEMEMEIQAPVQAVDPTAQTLTLLGLGIDASSAQFEGDDDSDHASQPLDFSRIAVGQVVEVKLDPAKLPAFVATEIEVNNFTNQISVTLLDPTGQPVDDPTDDISVTVDQSVMVRQPQARGRALRMVRNNVHIELTTHGSFVVSGLAKGPATVRVVRHPAAGGVSAVRRAVPVLPNRSRAVTLRLHRTRS